MSDGELRKRLDHLDDQLHEIRQFIEDHKAPLARAMSLMDPGAKLRGAFSRKGSTSAGKDQQARR